jgi:predicted amidohydrolase
MNKNSLRVSLVQTNLIWEKPSENLAAISRFLQENGSLHENGTGTDLIVLPEMFTTGFTMNAALFAEAMPESATLHWMQECAKQYNAAVVGSFIVKEGGNFYNRLIFMRPDATFEQYDKRHLFAKGGEDKSYTAGTEKLVVEWRNWRIMPLICYDLRFPTWSRNTTDYDLLLYIANWPERRNAHWRSLLVARAIENQCYTIGVNRIGTDDSGLNHTGDSVLLDPFGEKVVEIRTISAVFHATISKEFLLEIREQLPFLKDRD